MANPWEMDWSGGQAPAVPQQRPTVPEMVVAPQPKQPAPRTAEQVEGDRLRNDYLRGQIAKQQAGDASSLSPEDRAAVLAEAKQKFQLVRSLDERSKNGWFATGFGASTMANIPGTTAKDVAADVSTVSNSGALQRIMEMAAANGGKNPLTPLSNADFIALSQSVANLDPAQSDEQFQRNLKVYEDIYRRAYIAAGGNPADLDDAASGDQQQAAAIPAMTSGNSPPPPSGGSGPLPGEPGFTPPVLSPAPDQMVAANGAREEDDPALAGLTTRYAEMLASSPEPGQMVQWLRGQGVSDPMVLRTAAQQADYRRKNPNVPLDRYDYSKVDDRQVPLSGYESAITAMGDNPVGAYFANAGQFLAGNTLDNFADDPERAHAAFDVISAQNPTASLAGGVSGAIMGSLGGEVMLGRLGVTNALARGFGADTIMGAANGAGMADNGNRAQNALLGAAMAAGGNMAGNLIAKGVRGVSSPAVRALQDAGVNNLTVGQAFSQSGKVGTMVKGLEDRIEGLPVIGEVVKDRRRQSLERYNAGAFDKALESIGGQIKGKVGEEAIVEAQNQVSDAFNRALSGRTAVPDRQFIGHLTAALNQAAQLPRVGSEILDGIADVLRAYDNQPALTGEMMQQISREFQALKVAYRNDPLAHRINKAINEADDAVLGMFDRQFAGMIPEYNAAREAYRRVSVLEDAVLAGKNTDGVFTPAQLGAADKANTKKFSGKRAAAAGKGSFQDYQRAGQNVLPSKVPDSGTAGRLVLPAVGAGLVGTDAATGNGVSPTTLTIGAVLAGAYSKAGQRLLTKPARGVKSGSVLRDNRVQRALTVAPAALGATYLPQQ